MAISMLLMELCDASATDVKVFYLILSANRLKLSPSIIIKAIIIVQGIGKETIPFMTLNIGQEEFGFHHLCQENDIADQVQFGNRVSLQLYFHTQCCRSHGKT